MIKTIAKAAVISNAKKITIKKIKAEIIHLSGSNITLYVINAIKKYK